MLQLARALLLVQPSMAPLLRLANEVALAVDAANPSRDLSKRLKRFHQLVSGGPRRIARHFDHALGPDEHTFATYSYSSTVIRALTFARKHVANVNCAESRPGNEGRQTARELARAGIRVYSMTDAGMMSVIGRFGAFVSGADAIQERYFINKTGTGLCSMAARKDGIPVWVLADTSKLWPRQMTAKLWRSIRGPREEVWPNPPAGIKTLNPYFEPAEFGPHIRFVTESGWMTPDQIRAEVRKVKVSPRLWALTH